jgi:putative transposase
LVLEKIADHFPRLKKIWADGAYAGKLVDWAQEAGQWALEIVKRSDTAVGFEVLPHRWIVERTFAWLGRFRRLSKDYEALVESSEAMIRIAMIRLMVRRLATARRPAGA